MKEFKRITELRDGDYFKRIYPGNHMHIGKVINSEVKKYEHGDDTFITYRMVYSSLLHEINKDYRLYQNLITGTVNYIYEDKEEVMIDAL